MLGSLARRTVLSISAAAVLAIGLPAAAQVMVTRNPVKDNTLYESVTGDISNGKGAEIFAGRTDGGSRRRAVMKFDLSTIPPGSTVTAATLRLVLNRAQQPGSFATTVHKLNADWGEGTSDAEGAGGGSGSGAPATTNDATWQHKFYNTQFWTTDGGDFVAGASSTLNIGQTLQAYTWTGAGLAADVSAWINTPATNFGWLIRGSEASAGTARRFDSREATTVGNRPLLSITYTPPNNPTGACCSSGGTCTELTQFDCGLLANHTYQGNGTTCTPNPCAQPTGACCLDAATCVIRTQLQCEDEDGGAYQGNNVTCTPNRCAPITSITLNPNQDNTLYESPTGTISNGRGAVLFAGQTSTGLIRRGLISFDCTSIPTNATVSSVRLQMVLRYTDGTIFQPSEVIGLVLPRNDWGEGASDAGGNELGGAPAQANDATWLHRFFPTTLWGAAGGDFTTTVRDTATVGNTIGSVHTWTSALMVSDVQLWVAQPNRNAGWGIIGDEAQIDTTRGFDTRQGVVPPRLIIGYQVAPPFGACCSLDGTCESLIENTCESEGKTWTGAATTCAPNPCPQPNGACCFVTGLCSSLTAAACASQSGTFQGNFTLCGDVTCPIILTPFVDALPIPSIMQPTTGMPGGPAHYDVNIVEVSRRLHRDLPNSIVWTYNGFYPGPTFEVRRDMPVTVTWINNLRDITTNILRTNHYFPVDTCLHGPDVTGVVPMTVTHLHGAKLMPDSDGHPDETFGPGTSSILYHYPNVQQAATMWYHDHALGLTRMNVYMGLAGFYLIRDAAEDDLNIPRGHNEVPLVIQDRSFNPNGSLKYNSVWMDHHFGEFVLVNGKVWPFMNVNRGKYRFRLLNGSGTRAYTLSIRPGGGLPMTFHQIGSDLGLLEAPTPITSLTILPGERADIVVNFQPFATGTQLTMINSAPAPFPSGAPESVIPNVMKFIVQAPLGHIDPLPAALVPVPRTPEAQATVTRTLELRRDSNPNLCPMHSENMWLINDLMWDDITETPRIGSTEIWRWVNRSGDTHPMHMHLVQFQILDRQAFVVNNNIITPTGPVILPVPGELGWKDTVQTVPNQITRVIAKFDGFHGMFPYHCHLLEHEDHEMMRQFNVLCDPPVIITNPPTSAGTCRGGNFSFGVSAVGDVLKYQWRRGVVDLANGVSPTGSTIFGAQAAILNVSNAQAGDTGEYTCHVSNPCGEQTSTQVHVVVCLPDINCSGLLSVQDIFDFLALYFANNLRADFNRNGVISVQDIFDFLEAYFTGCA